MAAGPGAGTLAPVPRLRPHPGTASAAPAQKESTMSLTKNRLRRALDRVMRDERGASTAEYAITVLAACGFAAVLVALLASGEVRELLMGIITSALSMGS
jgi:Flp pilus assembly pilin Flp